MVVSLRAGEITSPLLSRWKRSNSVRPSSSLSSSCIFPLFLRNSLGVLLIPTRSPSWAVGVGKAEPSDSSAPLETRRADLRPSGPGGHFCLVPGGRPLRLPGSDWVLLACSSNELEPWIVMGTLETAEVEGERGGVTFLEEDDPLMPRRSFHQRCMAAERRADLIRSFFDAPT